MSRRRVLAGAAREQPALQLGRDDGQLATRRGGGLVGADGTAASDPSQQRFASGVQAAQLPVLARFGGGDQRRPQPPVHQRVLPQHQLRPGDGVRHPGQRLVDQLPLRVAPPRPANRPRPRCTPSPTAASRRDSSSSPCRSSRRSTRRLRRVDLCVRWEEEEGFEPPALSRYGFQDRRLRPLGHSSGLTFLVEPGPSYPHCPVREAHDQTPGSLLTMTRVGGVAEHDAQRRLPEADRGCRRIRLLHGLAEHGDRVALPQHDLAVARAALLRDLASACVPGCCGGGSGGSKPCAARNRRTFSVAAPRSSQGAGGS